MTVRMAGAPPIELLDDGVGRPVLLAHCSASGAQQWAPLVGALSRTRRVIAPNLLGYGRTDPRSSAARRTLAGQAAVLLESAEGLAGPVDLIGHSFGAVLALEAAAALGERLGRIVLFEPNAFAILRASSHRTAFAEIQSLFSHVRSCAAREDLRALAERFADFFSGDGIWSAMPESRRAALAEALRFNPDEWEAVMTCDLDVSRWQTLANQRVLLVWARDTRRPLRAVAEVLGQHYPNWVTLELDRGGHMAPLLRPRPFNAAAMQFISGETTASVSAAGRQ
jgi:pimeloyl-ACP methyl ester carboxylesterase